MSHLDHPNQRINCVVIGSMIWFLNKKKFKKSFATCESFRKDMSNDIIVSKFKSIKKSLVMLWSFKTQKM